jgi:hypothetical protein
MFDEVIVQIRRRVARLPTSDGAHRVPNRQRKRIEVEVPPSRRVAVERNDVRLFPPLFIALPLTDAGTFRVIHEPHPNSAMRVNQVHKIEARSSLFLPSLPSSSLLLTVLLFTGLKRRYGFSIDIFEIDTSRRDEARSNL